MEVLHASVFTSPCPLVSLSPPLPLSPPSPLILLHERPILPRQALLQRILHHIIDPPDHVVGGEQEDFVRTVRPDRMICRNKLRPTQRIARRVCEMTPDDLRAIPMRPNHGVRMIRANGARPDGVTE